MIVLGLSGAVGHDASAAIYIDGKLIAAAEEERPGDHAALGLRPAAELHDARRVEHPLVARGGADLHAHPERIARMMTLRWRLLLDEALEMVGR